MAGLSVVVTYRSGTIGGTASSPNLDQMPPEQLRALAAQALQLQPQGETMSRKIQNDQTVIEQLTYEITLLKRHKSAKRSEQISPAQSSLLDYLLDTDRQREAKSHIGRVYR